MPEPIKRSLENVRGELHQIPIPAKRLKIGSPREVRAMHPFSKVADNQVEGMQCQQEDTKSPKAEKKMISNKKSSTELRELLQQQHLCPVTFEQFKKYTNIMQLVSRTCKEKYGDPGSHFFSMTKKSYLFYYLKPDHRLNPPLSLLKVNASCPESLREKIFEIPKRDLNKNEVVTAGAVKNEKISAAEMEHIEPAIEHQQEDRSSLQEMPKRTEQSGTQLSTFTNDHQPFKQEYSVTSASASKRSTQQKLDFCELKAEAHLCPVTLNQFRKYTNITELIRKGHCEEKYRNARTQLGTLIKRSFLLYYLRPKMCNKYPWTHLKIDPNCPEVLKEKLIMPQLDSKKDDKVEMEPNFVVCQTATLNRLPTSANQSRTPRKCNKVDIIEHRILTTSFTKSQFPQLPESSPSNNNDCRSCNFTLKEFIEATNIADVLSELKLTESDKASMRQQMYIEFLKGDEQLLHKISFFSGHFVAKMFKYQNLCENCKQKTLHSTFLEVSCKEGENKSIPCVTEEEPSSAATQPQNHSTELNCKESENRSTPCATKEETSSAATQPQKHSTELNCKESENNSNPSVPEEQPSSTATQPQNRSTELSAVVKSDASICNEERSSVESISAGSEIPQRNPIIENVLQTISMDGKWFGKYKSELLKKLNLRCTTNTPMPVTFHIFKTSSYFQLPINQILCDYCGQNMKLMEILLQDKEIYDGLVYYYYLRYFTNRNLRQKYPLKFKCRPESIRNRLLSFVDISADKRETQQDLISRPEDTAMRKPNENDLSLQSIAKQSNDAALRTPEKSEMQRKSQINLKESEILNASKKVLSNTPMKQTQRNIFKSPLKQQPPNNVVPSANIKSSQALNTAHQMLNSTTDPCKTTAPVPGPSDSMAEKHLSTSSVNSSINPIPELNPKKESASVMPMICSNEKQTISPTASDKKDLNKMALDNNEHLEQAKEIFFQPAAKINTFPYMLRTSYGLKQRITETVSKLTFDEFKSLTHIFKGQELYHDTEDILQQMYKYVFKTQCVWPRNLYLDLKDMLLLLRQRNIAVPDASTLLMYISPKFLHWSNLIDQTNLPQCVYLHHLHDKHSKLDVTDAKAIENACIEYYNRCWTFDHWIGDVPQIAKKLFDLVLVSGTETVQDDRLFQELSVQPQCSDMTKNITTQPEPINPDKVQAETITDILHDGHDVTEAEKMFMEEMTGSQQQLAVLPNEAYMVMIPNTQQQIDMLPSSPTVLSSTLDPLHTTMAEDGTNNAVEHTDDNDSVVFVPDATIKQEPTSDKLLRNLKFCLDEEDTMQCSRISDVVVNLDDSKEIEVPGENDLPPSQIDFDDYCAATEQCSTTRSSRKSSGDFISSGNSGPLINLGQRLPSSNDSNEMSDHDQAPALDHVLRNIQLLDVNLESSESQPSCLAATPENVAASQVTSQETPVQMTSGETSIVAIFQEAQRLSSILEESLPSTNPATATTRSTTPTILLQDNRNSKSSSTATNRRAKAKVQPAKSGKSSDIVPQLAHNLRSLPVISVATNPTISAALPGNASTLLSTSPQPFAEIYSDFAPVQASTQQALEMPPPIRALNSPDSLRVSQELLKDNTLFNNTSLLRAVDHNYTKPPPEKNVVRPLKTN